jgi:hypothetical protein
MIGSCFPINSRTDRHPRETPRYMQQDYPPYAARSATNTICLSMKLGFICPNLPGHLNPMTALARHLQNRGHEVVVLYSSGAAGLPFVPGLEEDQIETNRPENEQIARGGCFAILRPLVAVQNGGDTKIIAGNCTGKRSRRARYRYRSILCGIGCDAVGYAVCTRCAPAGTLRLLSETVIRDSGVPDPYAPNAANGYL